MKSTLRKLMKIFGIVFVVAVIGLAVYIMANGLGLVDGLDFGAGAYYYADIPQFAKYVNGEHFKSAFPMWIHIVLFLIWGVLMYKLWIWLDKKL
ncbi:hypothetical protein [Pseudobutyrivibrio sp.]|jgi:hypothetical protein|uniref:hypothetical protein n=1 Tax=Pseudobutyrivibrio sp. TaxID=2014367 RepID=UPI0025FB1477|nr:hypothetical protein [Pseudobutyrivibrio sp.]